MNKIVRIGESHDGEILNGYFPAIVRWRKDTRETWQNCIDTGSLENFCVFLEVCHTNPTIDFVADVGWWFSYQNYVEIEFEDGTIKEFKPKYGNLTADKETFKEFVEFIDDYVSNGYELTDKTTVVLDDEDDLLVV